MDLSTPGIDLKTLLLYVPESLINFIPIFSVKLHCNYYNISRSRGRIRLLLVICNYYR